MTRVSVRCLLSNVYISLLPFSFSHRDLLFHRIFLIMRGFRTVVPKDHHLCFVGNGDLESPFSHASKASSDSLISIHKHFNGLQFHFALLVSFLSTKSNILARTTVSQYSFYLYLLLILYFAFYVIFTT